MCPELFLPVLDSKKLNNSKISAFPLNKYLKFCSSKGSVYRFVGFVGTKLLPQPFYLYRTGGQSVISIPVFIQSDQGTHPDALIIGLDSH